MCYVVLSASGGIRVQNQNMSTGTSPPVWYFEVCSEHQCTALFIFLDLLRIITSFAYLADVVVIVAVVILIGLFCMQHYGTDKVGWLFAPLVLLWFILIGSVGVVNIHKYNSSVLKAYNPVYIFRYFKRGKSEIWASLGGVMLSITGHWQFNCNFSINC